MHHVIAYIEAEGAYTSSPTRDADALAALVREVTA